MTEYELLDVIGQHTDIMLSLLQWWAGITLGMLVGVHVIGRDLNGYIACLLIAIYIAFTGMISVMASAHRDRQLLLISDLEQLQEQGIPIGKMAQHVAESGGPPPLVAMFALIAYWGLIISTIAYTIYCYRKAKRAEELGSP